MNALSRIVGRTLPKSLGTSHSSKSTTYTQCYRPFTQRLPVRRLVVSALFDFASTQKVTGRRNRNEVRREKFRLAEVVKTICMLTPKQLKSVSHMLDDVQLKAINLANSIDRTNPARGRQESLVAKLIRVELDEEEIARLGEMAQLAMSNKLSASPENAEQQDLVERWMEGIMAGDASIIDELFNLPASCNMDGPQLRQLIRQYEQHQQQQKEQAAAANSSSIPSGDIEFVQDPELLELLAQRDQKSKQKQQGSKKKQTPSKQLRKFLAGPAKQVVKLQQQAVEQE